MKVKFNAFFNLRTRMELSARLHDTTAASLGDNATGIHGKGGFLRVGLAMVTKRKIQSPLWEQKPVYQPIPSLLPIWGKDVELDFWAATQCKLTGRYQRFGGTYCLHLQP
jgi:hypothetical protein